MGWQQQGYSRRAGKWNDLRGSAGASSRYLQEPRSGVIVYFYSPGFSLTGIVRFRPEADV
jgi:hypothetical protein